MMLMIDAGLIAAICGDLRGGKRCCFALGIATEACRRSRLELPRRERRPAPPMMRHATIAVGAGL